MEDIERKLKSEEYSNAVDFENDMHEFRSSFEKLTDRSEEGGAFLARIGEKLYRLAVDKLGARGSHEITKMKRVAE